MKDIISNLPKELTKKLGGVLQFVILVMLLIYVGFELSAMGWHNIFASLPTHPLFYLIFAFNFFLMPLSETFIYRKHWRSFLPEHRSFLPVLMRKQALNDVVVGYSGEAYLYIWARRNLNQDHKKSLSLIKDNALVSGATSSTMALILLVGFYLFGDYNSLLNSLPDGIEYVGGVMAISILIVLVLVFFGKHLIRVSAGEVSRIAGVHTLRLLLFEGLQVVQWSLILPDVPLGVWIGFIATKMMITRIPFTPNKESILLALSVTIVEFVPTGGAAVAAIFLTNAVMNLVCNVGVFTATSLAGFRSQKELEAADDASHASIDDTKKKTSV